MNNYERIQSLSLEELAEQIQDTGEHCLYTSETQCKKFHSCTECAENWLRQEVNNEK